MSASLPKKKQNYTLADGFKKVWPLAVFLILVVAVLKTPTEIMEPVAETPAPLSPDSPEYRARVNNYLQDVDQTTRLTRLKTMRLNSEEAPPLGPTGKTLQLQVALPGAGIDLRQDPQPGRNLQLLRTPSKTPNYRYHLDDRVYAQMEARRQQAELDRLYRQEFIQQFIANAARDGYDVKVDRNLNVKVINRKPQSSPEAQESSGAGTQ